MILWYFWSELVCALVAPVKPSMLTLLRDTFLDLPCDGYSKTFVYYNMANWYAFRFYLFLLVFLAQTCFYLDFWYL